MTGGLVGCLHSAGRLGEIELNVLVQFAEVTDDRLARCAEIARGATERGLVLDADELAETPYALLGTAGEIAEEIINHRNRWGITYFGIRTLDDFAPVIAAVRQHE